MLNTPALTAGAGYWPVTSRPGRTGLPLVPDSSGAVA